MSVYLSILKHWIIDPIQNSIFVPIFNLFTTHSIQTLLLLPIILPIFNHFTANPIKTLLLLPIILPILNHWIIDPLQKYIIIPILNHLTTDRIQNHIIVRIFDLLPTDPIKKFLLLPIIGLVGKQIKDHLVKFVFNHLLKCIFLPSKRRICYIFQCDSYVHKLNNQTEKLKKQRDRLQQSVVEAQRNGEQIHEYVTKWLSSANIEINEAKALVQRKEEANIKKCFFGLCPNLKGRYHLSKEAEKKASAIDKLLNQEGLDPISYPPPLQQIVEPSVYSREALPSRVLLLNQVMDALRDPDLYMIGIYGLGGVGKTTLAKEVQRKAVEEKLFKAVVMVPVSQTPDLRRIQGEIADFIGLKFDAQEVPGRASQLKESLQKSKVLIILDDIWTKLELNNVGIPLEEECKGSKLLLTSRSQVVLSREMGTEKEFSLEVLGEEETWRLFQMTVADANNPELLDIAIKVAKKCSGLPLLVSIVAADLKKAELFVWRDALVKLSDLDNEEIHGKVHKVLKSSFENLPSNEVKPLFLLCSLFGQSNIPTNHLLTYAMGLGLFKNIVEVEVARNRMRQTIEKLKTESLLLDGDMNGHVKMHDVVLDFARSIATKDQHAFFGITGNGLRQLWPTDENCTRIVLHHCNISEFPEDLKYPNVELLSIFTKDLNLAIPDLFFKSITKLKVLNLTGMCLMPLPSSLQFLKNLHSLYIHQCRLKDLAIVGDLKQLEFLSFEESDMVELPRQLGKLTQLKSLNLTKCRNLKVIPPNVLPKLSLLEELYMDESFDEWDLNGNASLMELEELRQLTTLEVRVSSAKELPNQLFSKELERYIISIGKWDDYRWTYETSRALRLKLETSIHLEGGLKKLLRGSGDLCLREVEGMENGLYNLNEEGFPKLKHLYIADNKAIRHIVDSTIWVSCDAFPILEKLVLNSLDSLEEICHGRLGTGSFSKLRTLKISGCGKLRKLFSFSTAKNLSQLQEMDVSNCDNLEAVIAEGSEDGICDNEVIEFPQLSSLFLSGLPRLRSICNPRKVPSETQIEMVYFPNLTRLVVDKCHSLKYIFKTSTVKSLSQLKILVIRVCKLMEEIILTEEFEAEKRTDKIVFLNLDFLQLGGLPNLIRFSNGYFIEFQSLREMKISQCPTLKNFVTNISNNNSSNGVQALFNEMAIFPNLQTMDVDGMDNLEYIWHGQFADDDSLCKLKSLRIERCSKLKVVFATSKNVMRRFQRLEELEIKYCDKIEEIYQMEELDGIDEVAFELRHLKIERMNSLKWIWSENANGVFTFPNLKSVQVSFCDVLKYVFPESTASGLLQLEELKVEYCEIKHVIGNTKSGEPYDFKWPQLKHFRLMDNRQKQNQLPPWLAKVAPNLETLVLDGIQFSEFPTGCFSKLKVVEVHSLDDVKTCAEVYGFLTPLCSLKKLVLDNADLEELFLLDDERAVVRLECLELRGLLCLKHIWKEGTFVPSEYLKTLIVSSCYSMIKIAVSSISFKNLTTLHVSQCKKLKNLVTPSTSKTMAHLMELRVEYCEMMTEIVADDGDDAEHEITFKQLKSLKFVGLYNLNSFCSRNNCNFRFPSLEELFIDNCSGLLMIFSCGDLTTPKLRTVQRNSEQHWEGNLNATIASIFTKQESLKIRSSSSSKAILPIQLQLMHNIRKINVKDSDKVQVVFDLEDISSTSLLCQLQKLRLIDLPMLTQLWNNDPMGILDFSLLEVLELDKCSSLRYAFTPSVASCLIQLRQIMVKNCEMMETIIKAEEAEERGALANKMILPSLKHIKIIKCPNLKDFISSVSRAQNPTDDEGRKQIQEIHQVCPNLETLGLDGINWMNVQFSEFPTGCFSKLKVVELHSLHDVKTCAEVYGFLALLRSLKTLVLRNADLEELFLLDDERAVVRLECLELRFSHCLKYIWKEGSFVPSEYLKTLIVSSCDSMIKIAASSISFKNLTTLHVSWCNKLKNLVTPSTSKTMAHLMELRVEYCEMMTEIVADDGDDAEHEITFKQLKSLEFVGLTNLNSFCSRNNCNFHFPSLEELLIHSCTGLLTIFSCGDFTTPKLQSVRTNRFNSEQHCEGNLNATIASMFTKQESLNIRSSSSSKAISPNQLQLMHNIRRMNVKDCDKVQVVFDLEAISSASLLLLLQKLCLINLPMLTQLWNKDPMGILDLSQLGVLELDKCSSLKYAFTPSVASCLIQLKQIMVKNCEMMETIIKAEEAEEMGALANKMILPSLESIDLECLPKLSSLYSGVRILECPLKHIKIIGCPNLKDFVSSLSGTHFPTDDEGRKQIQEIHQIAMTSLEDLVIDWDLIKCIFIGNNQPDFLSKLTTFGLKGFHGECGVFPLKSLPNMKTLILIDSLVEEIIISELNVSKNKHLVDANDPQTASIFQNLKRFEVCEYGRLKILMPSSVCFKNLTYLEVSKCDEMINLIIVSTAKSLVLLRTMIISQCKMMQEIVRVESDGSENVIGFNQLQWLKLDDLPSLTCFCSSNYAFNFPNLDRVAITKCPNMKTFSQQVLTPKLSKVETSEWYWDYEWEGSLNNTIQKLFMNGRDEKATHEETETNEICEESDDDDDEVYLEETEAEEKDEKAYLKERDETKADEAADAEEK